MQSAVRQNLHLETETDINNLANHMLNASYTYLSLVRRATFLSFQKQTEELYMFYMRVPSAFPGDVF